MAILIKQHMQIQSIGHHFKKAGGNRAPSSGI